MDIRSQFEETAQALLVRAPAKINLSLLVAGKRSDGFHNIETIMAKINFYDELMIGPNPGGGIEVRVRGPQWAPEGKENLVYKAAETILEAAGRSCDVAITLTKNIPAGSGLGSASSDAGAALLGLNRYLGLGMGSSALAALAGRLGSDVPFFLDGPLALCTSKGEKVKRLYHVFSFVALLVLPDVTVVTRKVYENYVHDGDLYERLSWQIKRHISKNRIDLVAGMCANMLETSCFGIVGELAELKSEIESLTGLPCALTGSGSAMFCIVENRSEQRAAQLQEIVREKTRCRSIIVTNNTW